MSHDPLSELTRALRAEWVAREEAYLAETPCSEVRCSLRIAWPTLTIRPVLDAATVVALVRQYVPETPSELDPKGLTPMSSEMTGQQIDELLRECEAELEIHPMLTAAAAPGAPGAKGGFNLNTALQLLTQFGPQMAQLAMQIVQALKNNNAVPANLDERQAVKQFVKQAIINAPTSLGTNS